MGGWVFSCGAAARHKAVPIRAEARVLGATLKKGDSITYPTEPSRHLYLVPATGALSVNGVSVNARDGAAITDERELTFTAVEDSEIVSLAPEVI